jgi:hypothetical protein
MQTVLRAFSWSLPRVGIALGAIVGLVVFSYVLLVVVIVVGQAATGFGN